MLSFGDGDEDTKLVECHPVHSYDLQRTFSEPGARGLFSCLLICARSRSGVALNLHKKVSKQHRAITPHFTGILCSISDDGHTSCLRFAAASLPPLRLRTSHRARRD